jgi:hypothetical protein
MTTIIRSARFAAELKTVPVPRPQAQVLEIPVQVHVQPRAYGQSSEQMPSPPQMPPPVAAAPVMPTYEEYKQRLGGELAVLQQQAVDSAREEGLKQAWQSVEAHYKGQLETLRALIE